MISKIKKGLRNLIAGGAALLICASAGAAPTATQPTVVIDAGHGGHDTGAMDNGVKEKDINLGVARELSELIKKKMRDVKVVMTRHDDTFISLQERANIANRNHGNLFVSIHTNSLDKNNVNRRNVKGASVYALGLNKDANNLRVAQKENSVIELESDYKQKYSGFDPKKDESYIIFEMAQKRNLGKSLKFADAAQKELVSVAGRADRGVKQAGFWVLWATSMPAVLVELDFICNPESARFISSKEGQKKLAEALYNAVEDYFDAERRSASKVKDGKPADKEDKSSTKKNSGKKNNRDKKSKSRKGKKNHSISETSDVSIPETSVAVADAGVAVLPAARKQSGRKIDNADRKEPASLGRSYSYAEARGRESQVGKRRRRSAAAARQSDARAVETDAISIGNESEWLAVVNDNAVEEETIVQPEPEPVQKEKGKKSKKKNKKKDNRHSNSSRRLILTASGEVKSVSGDEAAAQRAIGLKTHKSSSGHRPNTTRPTKVYKIQLLASEQHLNENNPRFHGLKPVRSFRENNMYKYTYGESRDRAEMEKLLGDVKKEIPDAFIISTTK